MIAWILQYSGFEISLAKENKLISNIQPRKPNELKEYVILWFMHVPTNFHLAWRYDAPDGSWESKQWALETQGHWRSGCSTQLWWSARASKVIQPFSSLAVQLGYSFSVKNELIHSFVCTIILWGQNRHDFCCVLCYNLQQREYYCCIVQKEGWLGSYSLSFMETGKKEWILRVGFLNSKQPWYYVYVDCLNDAIRKLLKGCLLSRGVGSTRVVAEEVESDNEEAGVVKEFCGPPLHNQSKT